MALNEFSMPNSLLSFNINGAFNARAYANAFAAYCEERSNNWATISRIIQDASSLDIDDYEDDEVRLRRAAIAQAEAALWEAGFDLNATINTQYGYRKVSELAGDVAVSSNSLDIGTIMSNFHENGIAATVEDVITSIIDDGTSLQAYAVALRATAQDSLPPAQYFSEQMSTVVSTNGMLNSQTFIALKQSLLNGASSADVLTSMYETTGAKENVEQDDYVYQASDAVKYTGASPVGPLDCKIAGGMLSAAAKVGCKLLGGIYSMAKTVITSAVGKAIDWVEEIAVNPTDLDKINDNGDHTIQYGAYHQSAFVAHASWLLGAWSNEIGEYQPGLDFIPTDAEARAIWNMVPEYTTFDTAFAKVVLRKAVHDNSVTSDDFSWSTETGFFEDQIFQRMNCNMRLFDIDYYPKVINPDVVMRVSKQTGATLMSAPGATTTEWESTRFQIMSAVQRLAKAADLYLCPQSENKLLTGVHLGYTLGQAVGDYTLFRSQEEYADPVSVRLAPQWSSDAVITNGDYFNALLSPSGSTRFLQALRMAVIARALDEWHNPIDFQFLAYNGTRLALDPTYRIRTDEDNAQRFQLAMTALIAVAAVVVTVAVVGFASSAITKRLAFKRQATLNRLNAKMARGEKLTGRERRKYLRATKKGGVASLFEQAAPGGADIGGSFQDPGVDIIMAAIVGSH